LLYLEYVIRKIHENQKGMELNGKHQLLVHTDDFNIVRENINTIRKKCEVILQVSRVGGLEVSTEETKNMFLSRKRNAGHNYNFQTVNNSFENVAKFK
jgi:hypothetical protein